MSSAICGALVVVAGPLQALALVLLFRLVIAVRGAPMLALVIQVNIVLVIVAVQKWSPRMSSARPSPGVGTPKSGHPLAPLLSRTSPPTSSFSEMFGLWVSFLWVVTASRMCVCHESVYIGLLNHLYLCTYVRVYVYLCALVQFHFVRLPWIGRTESVYLSAWESSRLYLRLISQAGIGGFRFLFR